MAETQRDSWQMKRRLWISLEEIDDSTNRMNFTKLGEVSSFKLGERVREILQLISGASIIKELEMTEAEIELKGYFVGLDSLNTIESIHRFFLGNAGYYKKIGQYHYYGRSTRTDQKKVRLCLTFSDENLSTNGAAGALAANYTHERYVFAEGYVETDELDFSGDDPILQTTFRFKFAPRDEYGGFNLLIPQSNATDITQSIPALVAYTTVAGASNEKFGTEYGT